MGSHSADYDLSCVPSEVFEAAKEAVERLGWKTVEEDAARGTLTAKTPTDFFRKPPRNQYASPWQSGSWGTTVTIEIKEDNNKARLHLESRTRFRMTLIEGRTKRDVQLLFQEITKLLFRSSTPSYESRDSKV